MFDIDSVVRLKVPENGRLHNALGEVASVEAWGCHVATRAAATGRFRALFAEMELIAPGRPVQQREVSAKDMGYTGNCCARCGSMKMVKSGSCDCCQECGETSGCS